MAWGGVIMAFDYANIGRYYGSLGTDFASLLGYRFPAASFIPL